MADCVDVLRRFFEEEGKGQVLTRQRTESWLPHLTTDTFYQCKTMEGGVPYIGKYVIRIDSNVTRKKQQGQSSRVEHVPFGNGSWMGMLLVFSTETGELLGWMPDGYLQRTRVGALYALAADYLARPDAEEVGLIGSGWQAGGQILGLRCVRNIKKVRVFSSNADRRSRFADELQASLGIEVRPVAAARDAFAKADIVALATNANEKVMESLWVEPGQHLSSVRFLELDPRSYARLRPRGGQPGRAVDSKLSSRRTLSAGYPGCQGPARAAGRDRGPRIFPPADQKDWSAREDLVSQRSEQLPTRRAVRRSGRLRPRSGTRKRIGPRPARGMVCPNTAAVICARITVSDETIKIGGE